VAPWWDAASQAPRPPGPPAKSGLVASLPTIQPPRPLAPLDEVADVAEARDDGAAPVVWRASPRSLSADPPEDAAPVVQAGLRDRVMPHHGAAAAPRPNDLPKELDKVTMPPYRIEPPDILLIDAFRVIPRPPYKIEPLDELVIQAPPAQVIPNEPIAGIYPVGPDGQVDLGYSYGKVAVAGLTPEQARATISKHVADVHGIKPPAVSVALGRTRGFQQIRGEHLVRMDGTVSLGVYGDAYVAGMTLPEAKQAVEAQLARSLLNPQVTVDVLAYNSKVYYVIYDGGGFGQQIYKLPVVGGETVLDALSELRGLPAPSSTKRIWIARPVPGQVGCRQILPVDWAAITEGAATNTNYQLFPGDRIYVKADFWVALENGVTKVVAPFERIFGFTLLGNATIRAVAGQQNGNNGGGF
jgi:polysaccharide export outer membrane protein